MGRARALVHAHVGATIFAVALAGGVLLHLPLLPLFPRLIVANVNQALQAMFRGHVYIDRVGKIGLTGVTGLDAHVDDADGGRLLTIEGVDVRFSAATLLRSLTIGTGPIHIDIPDLSVARADIRLDPDAGGVPRIARAFEARAPTPSAARGRSVRLALPHAYVAHASIHGEPNLDADLDGADVDLLLSDEGVAVDLGRGRLTVRGLASDARASGIAQAHLEEPAAGARVIRASWQGAIGAVVERADLALHGNELDGSLDVSPTGSAEVCAILPQWPIAAVCGAHAEAHGTLPLLTVAAHASVGGGTVDLSGPVTLGATVQAALHVGVRGFDGRALVSPIPCSNIDLGGDVSVSARSTGDVDGRAAIVVTSARCGTTRVPTASLAADFVRTAQGDISGHADVAIREPGAPTAISLRLAPGPDGSELFFEGTTNAANLEQVARLNRTVSGNANLQAAGKIDLGALSIDARASANIADFRARSVSAASIRVEARASGRLLAPSLDIDVEAETVSAPDVSLSAVSAEGQMTLDGGLALHQVRIDFAGDGPPIHARAELASLLGRTARLEGAVVEGLGAPLAAEVTASPTGLTVRSKSAGIDLERVASFASIPLRAGKLSLDVDTTVTADSAEGRIALDLSHGVTGGLRNLSAHVEAVLHGRGGHGSATAALDDIGTLEVHSTSLVVGKGGLLTPAPWRKAWGALNFDARADLAKVFERLPGFVPTGTVQGYVEVAARVGRDSQEDMTPEVDVAVRTAGLVVSGTTMRGAWRLDGIDPVLRVIVNGDTGDTALDVQVRDAAGELATLKASSPSVPYATIFSDVGIADALLATPFSARLEIPSRSLASLPRALGLVGRRGDLQARVDWRGAVVDPTVNFAGALMRGAGRPQAGRTTRRPFARRSLPGHAARREFARGAAWHPGRRGERSGHGERSRLALARGQRELGRLRQGEARSVPAS